MTKLIKAISSFFHLEEQNTSFNTEIVAGISTFLTMSYVLFINPSILGLTGMNSAAVFVATCLAASLGSAMMGLVANYPIALAPGLALSTYFTYGVVLKNGHTWQTALGAVMISGAIFLLISLLPIRHFIINSIPKTLKLAIVAGIGLFLGIIGFKNAGIIVANQATLVTLGDLHNPTTLLAIFGFFIIVALDALEFTSGVIISILTITSLGIFLGYSHFNGIIALPPSITPTFLQFNFKEALGLGFTTILFAFLFVDLFDNVGTLIGVAHRAHLMDKHGHLPRLKRVFIVASTAAMAGAAMGTSTTTSYLESAVGVKVGGRTGLTALTVAVLFLFSLFLSPLATSVPLYATAPALVYVACLMTRAFAEIDWNDVTEYAPAIITAFTMPLTFSIADGISLGFITYTAIKLTSGRWRELNLTTCLLAIAFIIKHAFVS